MKDRAHTIEWGCVVDERLQDDFRTWPERVRKIMRKAFTKTFANCRRRWPGFEITEVRSQCRPVIHDGRQRYELYCRVILREAIAGRLVTVQDLLQ